MKENNWEFTFPESLLKTIAELNKIQWSASAQAISEVWKAAVPNYKIDGVYAALNEIVASQKEWEKLVIPTISVSAMAKEIIPVLERIDTSVMNAYRDSAFMTTLAKTDWSWLSEAYAENNEEDTDDVTSDPAKPAVTEEIRAEMAEDIKQILSDPDTMSLASQSKYLQWKDRNPGLAAFFIEILLPILLLIADWGFSSWQARPNKDAHVYEAPVATSNVVYNITVENNITVIGDVPYYYEVEFPHPETGELITGYVSKRNLTAEGHEETEAWEKETEATKTSETVPDTTEDREEFLE